MTTYTIRVNERTKAGRALVRYLRKLGVLAEPNEATIAAMRELESGGGTRCKTFEEYLDSV